MEEIIKQIIKDILALQEGHSAERVVNQMKIEIRNNIRFAFDKSIKECFQSTLTIILEEINLLQQNTPAGLTAKVHKIFMALKDFMATFMSDKDEQHYFLEQIYQFVQTREGFSSSFSTFLQIIVKAEIVGAQVIVDWIDHKSQQEGQTFDTYKVQIQRLYEYL